MTEKKAFRGFLKPYDLFFFAAMILLCLGYIHMAGTGLGVPDESFYVTIPHRLLQGDSLIVDDWHVSQFSAFAQYLPVKLFYEHFGSLNGVILFLRYLYVVCQTVTLVILYPLFRKYKWRGAAALAVFGGYIPVCLEALNYYTLCLWPAVIVCAVLHLGQKPSKPLLILCGILTGLAVLAEPLIAFCFFAYTLIVWINIPLAKKQKALLKDYAYCVNTESWLYITVGVFICAFAFLPFLFRGSDIASTVKAIPWLFNGFEYDFSLSGGNIQTLKVVNRALSIYGKLPAAGLAAVTAAAFIGRKKRRQLRPFLLSALLVFVALAYGNAVYHALKSGRNDYFSLFYGLPLYLSGPALYRMLEKKEKNLWALWCTGAALSLLLDISSAVILGVCGAISSCASVMFLFSLIGECAAEHSRAKEERKTAQKVSAAVSAAVVTALLISFVGVDVWYDVRKLNFNFIESDWCLDFTQGQCDTLLERGAYKGIRTTKTVAAKYNAMHDDFDTFAAECESFLIFDRFPYAYLYLDAAYSTFSAWYVDLFEDERLLYYYEVHPEKTPDVIYLPFYDPYTYRTDPEAKEKLARLTGYFDCEVTKAKAGYILRVK